MPYYGGTSGEAAVGGHYELLHAGTGVVRVETAWFSGTPDSFVLPADMTAQDQLDVRLRVWLIGGTAGPDFAEFWPWLGQHQGSSFLWPNVDTSALHFMNYRIATTRGSGLVASLDQRNAGSEPSFWTNSTSAHADMQALAGLTMGLSCDAYLMSSGYYDWGWAWTIHRIHGN